MINLLTLFITFFKIGAFTFGGGYAMLPMVQQEVLNHGWMSEQELINFIAVSESTPGPFAVNVSTYIGAVTGGFFGAVCASLGVILPSFIIILLVARAFGRFQSSRVVQGCMRGLRPNVVGLIAASVLSVAAQVFFPEGITAVTLVHDVMAEVTSTGFWVAVVIFIVAVYLRFKKKVHPIKLILLSGAIGIVAGYAGLLGVA